MYTLKLLLHVNLGFQVNPKRLLVIGLSKSLLRAEFC